MVVTDEMVLIALERLADLGALNVETSLDEDTNSVRAALTAALESMWRPIEEAPKDLHGPKFLGLTKSGRCVTAIPAHMVITRKREDGGHDTIGSRFSGYNECEYDAITPVTLTHWMPLPAPPVQQKEGV